MRGCPPSFNIEDKHELCLFKLPIQLICRQSYCKLPCSTSLWRWTDMFDNLSKLNRSSKLPHIKLKIIKKKYLVDCWSNTFPWCYKRCPFIKIILPLSHCLPVSFIGVYSSYCFLICSFCRPALCLSAFIFCKGTNCYKKLLIILQQTE